MTVAWPSGLRQSFQNVAGDQFYTLVEGGRLTVIGYRR